MPVVLLQYRFRILLTKTPRNKLEHYLNNLCDGKILFPGVFIYFSKILLINF